MSTALADRPSVASSRARWWGWVLAVWTLYGVLQVALVEMVKTTGKSSYWWSGPMMLAVGLFWAAATPLVFAVTPRLRPSRVGWVRSALAHVALALALAAAVMFLRRTVRIALEPTMERRFLLSFVYMLDYNLITYAMLVVVGDALDRYREYAERARSALRLETQLARARLQFLQRQLHPHFLFNALNAVAELARESPDAARGTLHDLQRLLRSALGSANATEVTLREELTTLEPYLRIQRTRFSDSLDIACRAEASSLEGLVPPLVLQPLVENAIRHGRTGHGERGRVTVSARVSGPRLQLRVVDDGPSFASPTITPTRSRVGIGLRNTAERLTQLYGADHRFALFHESGAGTVVELEIPYRTVDDVRRGSAAGATISPQPDQRAAAGGASEPTELMEAVSLQPSAVGDDTYWTPRGGTPAAAPAVRPGASEPHGAPRLSWRGWSGTTAFWLGCGVYWMAQTCLVQLVRTGRVQEWTAGRIDMVSALVWAALTPIVLALARRVRITRRALAGPILFHLGAALAFGALHLAIVFNAGVDDRALLLPANVDPFTLDVFIYFALLAWSHARDFAAWYDERGLAAARTEAAIARAHWQTLALEVHPEFLLAALGAAADLTRVDPARAERVVEQLGDLLRATLDAPARGARSVRDELAILGKCLELHRETTGGTAALECVVDARTLDVLVPAGAFHQAVDRVLACAASDRAGQLRVRVETRRQGGKQELVVRSDAPPPPPAVGAPVGLQGAPAPRVRNTA